jgi:hypothetical protein
MKLWEVLPEFIKALEQQLRSDDERWGDTWIKRTREGQEERTIVTFNDYFDQYLNAGKPINWLAVAGNALICWYREQHPEMWKK